MRCEKLVPMTAIKIDRVPLNPETLALVEYLRGGGDVPAIHCHLSESGIYEIRDGRHRYTAYRLLGKQEILVRFGKRSNG